MGKYSRDSKSKFLQSALPGHFLSFQRQLSFLALNGRLSEDRNSELQQGTLQRLSQSFKQHGACLEAMEPTPAFQKL